MKNNKTALNIICYSFFRRRETKKRYRYYNICIFSCL